MENKKELYTINGIKIWAYSKEDAKENYERIMRI
tara:strand:+ start:407 stop:508 length:102 start_codon:yes stop_codon:yes gene_type:complete